MRNTRVCSACGKQVITVVDVTHGFIEAVKVENNRDLFGVTARRLDDLIGSLTTLADSAFADTKWVNLVVPVDVYTRHTCPPVVKASALSDEPTLTRDEVTGKFQGLA